MINSEEVFDIAIIGGGAAGLMALNRSVLNGDRVLFFSGNQRDKKKSRAQWVSKVENVPGLLSYKRAIDQPNREMLQFLEEKPHDEKWYHCKNVSVTSLTKNEDQIFYITDSKGAHYKSRYVLLCTGIMDVQPNIKGQIENIFPFANSQQADYCLRCDGHHVVGKHTGVIGHTMSAAWVAIMLQERYLPPSMTLYTHGENPNWSEKEQQLILLYGIKVVTDSITDFTANENKKLTQIVTTTNAYGCEHLFISLGVIVYNELAIQLGANIDSRGYVLSDKVGKTNIDGFYVAGDVKADTKKQIYTAWDHAVDAADAINQLLRISKRDLALRKDNASL
jgi:thioredoxin reductase (NADPH)